VDHNKGTWIGRLTKDPEFHPAGRKGDPHCTFTLAINRVVPNEGGPQADFIPCTIWGEEAERFCQLRSKGDEVGIMGRIRTNNVPQPDGSYRFHWEVRALEGGVQYGRRSLKNLQPRPAATRTTQAVGQLTAEFQHDGQS